MSRHRRAVITTVLAAVAGLVGMSLAGDFSESASNRFGPLEPVVVTTEFVPAGSVLDSSRAELSMERRRIPALFAPSGSFVLPSQVIGLEARVDLAPGSYVTSASFAPPGGKRKESGGPPRGVVPVEVSVHGVGAIPGPGRRVDVLVSSPDGPGGAPDTEVAARSALLLELAPEDEVGSEPGTGRVTLGLSRRAAIGLVDAEAAGRRITLIPVRVR